MFEGYERRSAHGIRPTLAHVGVGWLWYVDLEVRTVTVSRLIDGAWSEVAVHGEDERVRLAPFADLEIDLRAWWAEPSAPP